MTSDDPLRQQIEEAIRQPQARYIVTALIGDEEYDAGEIVIGPRSDPERAREDLGAIVTKHLQQACLSRDDIANAVITIADVPLLY
jgi:hypothetical protein